MLWRMRRVASGYNSWNLIKKEGSFRLARSVISVEILSNFSSIIFICSSFSPITLFDSSNRCWSFKISLLLFWASFFNICRCERANNRYARIKILRRRATRNRYTPSIGPKVNSLCHKDKRYRKNITLWLITLYRNLGKNTHIDEYQKEIEHDKNTTFQK